MLSACRDAPIADEVASAIVDGPPEGTIGIEARFGNRIDLIGYLLAPRTLTQRAGKTVTLTLLWRVEQPLDDGYLEFTHLLDGRGQLLANLDDKGSLHAVPPSHWPAEKMLIDRVEVPLPKDAPESVAIAVGFYRGTERLDATGGGADAVHRAALVKLNVTGSIAGALPSIEVPRLSASVRLTIDGALDEPAWSRAAKTRPFVNVATGRSDPRAPVQGRARLLYDETFFYLAVEVDDADLRGGFPARAVDAHLWTADTVEVMIDPDGDGDNRDYYEIQINPQNLVFDSQFDDYNEPRGGKDGPFGHQEWSVSRDCAVGLRGTVADHSDRDQAYVVECRLRWSSFDKARRLPPQPGDRWRMNIYAIDAPAAVAWSPILGQGNFHRASRFGRVTFGARTVE